MPCLATPASAWESGLGTLHDQLGGSVLGLDGHRVFVTVEKFNRESNLPRVRRNLLWWSPWSKDGH